MSRENPNWGASRIHGELLMLGFEVAQSTVSKYMVRGGSPSQTWKTFFRNHAQAIAAIDLFVVPTLTFERLFAFLVLGHGRRQLLWFEVTRQHQRPPTWCGTTTVPTDMPSPGLGRWASATDRSRLDRRGKIHMWSGLIGTVRRECLGPDAGLWRGAPATN